MTNNKIQEELGNISNLSINEIALFIERTWPNVSMYARPYLNAMHRLKNIDDSYGIDSGKLIVSYFLSNASTYRGNAARIVKAELKSRLS